MREWKIAITVEDRGDDLHTSLCIDDDTPAGAIFAAALHLFDGLRRSSGLTVEEMVNGLQNVMTAVSPEDETGDPGRQ